MAEVRLMMMSEPAPCPSCVQEAAPALLDHSPRAAIPAINMSASGRAETRERLPHSEDKPAKLAVAFSQPAVGLGGPPSWSPQYSTVLPQAEAARATTTAALLIPLVHPLVGGARLQYGVASINGSPG